MTDDVPSPEQAKAALMQLSSAVVAASRRLRLAEQAIAMPVGAPRFQPRMHYTLHPDITHEQLCTHIGKALADIDSTWTDEWIIAGARAYARLRTLPAFNPTVPEACLERGLWYVGRLWIIDVYAVVPRGMTGELTENFSSSFVVGAGVDTVRCYFSDGHTPEQIVRFAAEYEQH